MNASTAELYFCRRIVEEKQFILNSIRVEETTFKGYIAVLINAAARIPASTEEYVKRSVTITAQGLTAPVLTNTLVSVVVRLKIQGAAKTSPETKPPHQENTIS